MSLIISVWSPVRPETEPSRQSSGSVSNVPILRTFTFKQVNVLKFLFSTVFLWFLSYVTVYTNRCTRTTGPSSFQSARWRLRVIFLPRRHKVRWAPIEDIFRDSRRPGTSCLSNRNRQGQAGNRTLHSWDRFQSPC